MRKKQNKRMVYEELLNKYRPTIKSILLEILMVKLFNLQKGKEPIVKDGALFVPEDDRLKHLPLKYIAITDKNEKVVEMIRINEETAELILDKKNNLVIFDPKTQIVKKGMFYKEGQFIEKNKNEEKN